MKKKCEWVECREEFDTGNRPTRRFHSRRCKELAGQRKRRAAVARTHRYNGDERSTRGRIKLNDTKFIKSLGYKDKKEATAALRKWERQHAIDGAEMEKWYRKQVAVDHSDWRGASGG